MEEKTIDGYFPYDLPSQYPEYKAYKAFIEWLKGQDPGFRRLSKMTVIGDGNRRVHDGWVYCHITYDRQD